MCEDVVDVFKCVGAFVEVCLSGGAVFEPVLQGLGLPT